MSPAVHLSLVAQAGHILGSSAEKHVLQTCHGWSFGTAPSSSTLPFPLCPRYSYREITKVKLIFEKSKSQWQTSLCAALVS